MSAEPKLSQKAMDAISNIEWTEENDCLVKYDLPYGDHERQILDLWLPKNASGDLGLFLYIHGGAWVAGDKCTHWDRAFCSTGKWGYVSASMNYHFISDTTDCFTILDDITLAMQAVKLVCEAHGIHLTKSLLTGGSAGGHLSLQYGYTRYDEAPVTPGCVVSYCGPSDVSDSVFLMDNLIGEEDDRDAMFRIVSRLCGRRFTKDTIESARAELDAVSPINFVNENTVPTIMAHGLIDNIVPYDGVVKLNEKLARYGVRHHLVPYPNSGHDLSRDPAQTDETERLMKMYAKEYLR